MQMSFTLMPNHLGTVFVETQCLQAPAYLQRLPAVMYEFSHILLAAGFFYFLIFDSPEKYNMKISFSELTTIFSFSFDQDKGTVCGSQKNNG